MNFKDYKRLAGLVSNPADCPAKGGNVSIKDNFDMIIKSSGTRMRDMKFATLKNNKWDGLPSMEWKMHHSIDKKYVCHYHPFYLYDVICTDSNDIVFENYSPVFVPYVEPGDCLADELLKYKLLDDEIIILKNHGVIIYGDTFEEVEKKYEDILLSSNVKNIGTNLTPDDALIDDIEQIMHNIAGQRIINLFAQNQKVIELTNQDIQSLQLNKSEILRQEK